MAKAVFNPNPYDNDVTLGGVGDGENPVGKEYYIKFESTNYYVAVQTTPPTYQVKYGAGWNPKNGEIRGTFNTEGYGRIAACLDTLNSMTDFEYDGGNTWGIYDLTILGITNGRINNIGLSGWTATKTISVENADGSSTTTIDETTQMRFGYSPLIGAAMNNIAPRCIGSLTTNIPVFLTKSQAEDYLRTGNTDGQINVDTPVEPQTYDYYMYNQITTTLGAGYDWQYLYRYKMEDGKRLALYMYSQASYPQFDRMLIGTDGIDIIYRGDNISDENFPQVSGTDTHFLGSQRKMESGTTYTPLMYQTNIPTFDTYSHALNYIETGDETGIIDKWRTDEVVPGEIGEPTDETEQGTNGALFTYGGGIYRLSNAELATFFSEAFDPTPSIRDAILEGLQLFGQNQINAISDIMYIPFSADEVATLSSGSDIYLGSYKMQTVTGDRVQKNDKLINMGTHYFAPPYGSGDARNYEPDCHIYVMLPYAGTHELQISKYIGKNVTIKFACDLTTGSATYFILAGLTIMDSFDCVVGAHRPITAVDQQTHVSQITNGIIQTVGQGVKTLSSGAGAVTGAFNGAAEGGAVGAISAGTSGIGGAASGAVGTILSGYDTYQQSIDAPMTERGSFSGFIGTYDIKSPYFIFAQRKPLEASNLIQVMGKPSSEGGLVSKFYGFLQAAAFDLADGFTGTEEEAQEIRNLMAGGVYID